MAKRRSTIEKVTDLWNSQINDDQNWAQNAGHNYCLSGHLSQEVGWGYYDTIKELEEKRKEKAKVSYERRKQLTRLRVKAENAADEKLGSQLDILAPIKY